jgi:hypothetical protein
MRRLSTDFVDKAVRFWLKRTAYGRVQWVAQRCLIYGQRAALVSVL